MNNSSASLRSTVFQDWQCNGGSPQIQVLLALFRTAQLSRRPGSALRPLAPVFTLLYRSAGLFMVGVDMPVSTVVGPRLAIRHGIGLVVHAKTQIGADVVLRHNVTLGAKESGGAAPRIGDRADIGVGALVIGGRYIGAGARVGAGTVVLSDVPDGAIVVGNPGRLIGEPSKGAQTL